MIKDKPCGQIGGFIGMVIGGILSLAVLAASWLYAEERKLNETDFVIITVWTAIIAGCLTVGLGYFFSSIEDKIRDRIEARQTQ